jgi:predicted RNA methylase
MRLKQLESSLSNVKEPQFNSPNVTLEQYATSPYLTAQVISLALEKYGDLGPSRTVLDLGCGTAMLSIGWYVYTSLKNQCIAYLFTTHVLH